MPVLMALEYQSRLWCYVNASRRHKLRRLLRRHRQVLDLGEAVGHKSWTPLHRSCARQDHKTALLLMKYGADPFLLDQHGDTALHVAARQAARKGGTVYEDLFVPLRNQCPTAMSIRNRDGKTPADLLGQTEDKWCPQEILEDSDMECEAEREWNRKLLGELQDEYQETCWRYEVPLCSCTHLPWPPKDKEEVVCAGCHHGNSQHSCRLCQDGTCTGEYPQNQRNGTGQGENSVPAKDFWTASPDPETYEDWADRIAREYSQKRWRAEDHHQQQRKPKTEPQKPVLKLQHLLEEEHLLYEKRGRAKEEELKVAKRARYEEGCSRVFTANSSHPLSYADIPWPWPGGTAEEMAAVALHGADPSDRAAYRRFLRRQQALWHPDKFAQRCGARLAERDRRKILDMVTALSQAFNRLAEAAK